MSHKRKGFQCCPGEGEPHDKIKRTTTPRTNRTKKTDVTVVQEVTPPPDPDPKDTGVILNRGQMEELSRSVVANVMAAMGLVQNIQQTGQVTNPPQSTSSNSLANNILQSNVSRDSGSIQVNDHQANSNLTHTLTTDIPVHTSSSHT